MMRYRCIKAAAMLPFGVLGVLTRFVPIWRDDSDWPIWLDADYHRYCRFEIALWGWREGA